MSTFPDLSPYVYGEGGDDWLNVGWLGPGVVFPTGHIEDRLLAKLAELATDEKNVMRGYYECDFCDKESPIRMGIDVSGMPFETQEVVPRRDMVLGHGEVHVPGDGGVVYAAPTLVLHYIMDHHYLPPQEFLDALKRLADAPDESGT